MLARYRCDILEQEAAFIEHVTEVNAYDRQLRLNEASVSLYSCRSSYQKDSTAVGEIIAGAERSAEEYQRNRIDS